MRYIAAWIVCVIVLSAAPMGAWKVITSPTPDTPQRVRLAPLDGDALPDIAFTAGPLTPDSPIVLGVWRNQGNGRFERHWVDRATSNFGPNGVPLEIADLDENGLADLVLGNVNGSGGFSYRLGSGDGVFAEEFLGPSFGGYVDDVSVTDYDDDGQLDVGTTTFDLGNYVDRFKGDGDGSFSADLPFSNHGGGGISELTSGDLDGDNLPEDVVTNAGGLFVLAQGDAFTPLIDTPLARAVIADFDADGLGDIAATAPLAHEILIVRSLGAGDFSAPATLATGRRPTALVAVDHDLDGDLDLAVCNSQGRSVWLLDNDGAARFSVSRRILVGSGPNDIAAADLDADGDPDLVVANAGEDSLSVLLNPQR